MATDPGGQQQGPALRRPRHHAGGSGIPRSSAFSLAVSALLPFPNGSFAWQVRLGQTLAQVRHPLDTPLVAATIACPNACNTSFGALPSQQSESLKPHVVTHRAEGVVMSGRFQFGRSHKIKSA